MESERDKFLGIMTMLGDLGVKEIEVSYDGSGDSGEITSVEFLSVVGKDVFPKNKNIDKFIEEFASEKLLNDIEDWWNNDGGWGIVTIQVPSGDYVINNNVRIVSDDNYMHEGSISKMIGGE